MTSQKWIVRFDNYIQRQLIAKESRNTVPPKSEQTGKLSKPSTKNIIYATGKVYSRGGRPRRLPGATVTGCVISTCAGLSLSTDTVSVLPPMSI